MPDLPQNILDFAAPFFIALIILEMFLGRRNGSVVYDAKDTATSLIMGLGSTIFPALFGVIVVGSSLYLYENFRLFDLGSGWLTLIVAFIMTDFFYYWIHRFGHRIRWFWASHVIHHSSQHYNLSTALRQTWTGPISMGFVVYMPLYLLGFHPFIVFFMHALNLIYQFWFHTEAIDKCPNWFEAIMNTPSHHRVHHSTNPEYLDANYAGVFIVWDKLFGTFVPEDKSNPCRYGLVSNLGTFNPIRVALHEWVAIFKDWRHAKNLKEVMLYALAPPGWTPDGSRMTSDMIKAEWREKQLAIANEKKEEA